MHHHHHHPGREVVTGVGLAGGRPANPAGQREATNLKLENSTLIAMPSSQSAGMAVWSVVSKLKSIHKVNFHTIHHITHFDKNLRKMTLSRDAWSIFFLQDCLGLDRNPTRVRNRALFC